MPGFGIEVIEKHGHRSRTAMTASDYEELAEKIAAKTGIQIDAEDVDLVADGGED